MTTVSRTAPTATGITSPSGMDRMRRIALAGGVLYLVTFAASIPQLKLFSKIVDDPGGVVTSSGSNGSLYVGSWLEIVTALAGIGTAVALYPVTRRVSRSAAIGFISSRVVEACLIMVGVVSLLSVVALRDGSATGAHAEALRVTGHALIDMRQWTFLVGPGIMPAVNAVFLGYAMRKSGLVPRLIPTIGLVGAPLLLISSTGTIFGLWAQTSTTAFFFALPIATWEFSLGVWLTVKGFRPADVAALDAAREPGSSTA